MTEGHAQKPVRKHGRILQMFVIGGDRDGDRDPDRADHPVVPGQGLRLRPATIDTLYDVLLIVSVPIFVLVLTVVLYSVWKFRMRPGEEDKDGPPIHGNTRLEVVWTAVPGDPDRRPLHLRLHGAAHERGSKGEARSRST